MNSVTAKTHTILESTWLTFATDELRSLVSTYGADFFLEQGLDYILHCTSGKSMPVDPNSYVIDYGPSSWVGIYECIYYHKHLPKDPYALSPKLIKHMCMNMSVSLKKEHAPMMLSYDSVFENYWSDSEIEIIEELAGDDFDLDVESVFGNLQYGFHGRFHDTSKLSFVTTDSKWAGITPLEAFCQYYDYAALEAINQLVNSNSELKLQDII